MFLHASAVYHLRRFVGPRRPASPRDPLKASRAFGYSLSDRGPELCRGSVTRRGERHAVMLVVRPRSAALRVVFPSGTVRAGVLPRSRLVRPGLTKTLFSISEWSGNAAR